MYLIISVNGIIFFYIRFDNVEEIYPKVDKRFYILIHCIDKEISLPLLLSPLATDIDCTIYFKRTFTRITTLKVFSIDRY